MMDYKGCKCASCHKVLKEGDDIVICPECGAPYHRECYAAEGRCVFSAKHGKGFEYVPPEAKPDVNANGPICPVCHAQNPPDTLFCERCGQPMRGGVPPQAAQSSPQYAEPGMSGTGMPGGFGGPGAQYATGDVMTQLHLAKEYDGISTQDWMKYIGNSAPYYLYQFQRMDESGRKTSFCWSALFIPEFYFFYRKMWGWGALALAVSLIVSIPSLLSLMAALGIATALPLSASALSTLITVCGLLNWGVRFLPVPPERGQADARHEGRQHRRRPLPHRAGTPRRAVPCGRGPGGRAAAGVQLCVFRMDRTGSPDVRLLSLLKSPSGKREEQIEQYSHTGDRTPDPAQIHGE